MSSNMVDSDFAQLPEVNFNSQYQEIEASSRNLLEMENGIQGNVEMGYQAQAMGGYGAYGQT